MAPPPKNGYGFIFDIKTGSADGNWSTIWPLGDSDKNNVRLTMLHNKEELTQQVIKAKSPTRKSGIYQNVIIARHQNSDSEILRSQFITLTEVAQPSQWPVETAKRITSKNNDSLVLEIILKDGRKDVFLFSNSPSGVVTYDDIVMIGKYGFIRFSSEGDVNEVMLNQGTSISVKGIDVKVDESIWNAKINKIIETSTGVELEIDKLFKKGTKPPYLLTVASNSSSSNPYIHNEAFNIIDLNVKGGETVIGLGFQGVSLGKTTIDSIDLKNNLISVNWPMTLGFPKNSKEYSGRRVEVIGDEKRYTHIISFEGQKKLKVVNAKKFKRGDSINIKAIQKGDVISIPSNIRLLKDDLGYWQIDSNHRMLINFKG